MTTQNNISPVSFLNRQTLVIKLVLGIAISINASFLILGLINKNGAPLLNLLYILLCCLPTYIFLRKGFIELATNFSYFPSIGILSIMIFYNLKGVPIHGNLENVLIPCVSLCFLLSNYVARSLGIGLNIILLISFKIIRYQNIPMLMGEIFDDLTVVVTVYGVSLFLGYYYKNDYFSLVEINTELQKQKRTVEQQAVELQKANNTKTRLFSIIAHDLRAPIISLKGLLQLYDSNKINEEGFRTLSKRLHENVNSANLLLDNLLIWSFSQIKDTKPTLIKLKLKSIIEEVIFLYKEAVVSKEIKVTNNFIHDLAILGDEQQIKIIFRNLINNAIKFTKINGSIFINAHQQGEFIVISIEDNGIGIKQEDLEHIFSKPKLNTGTNGENSTGLGLMLCQEMVTNHRGKIKINSQFGSGTTVVVQLPIST